VYVAVTAVDPVCEVVNALVGEAERVDVDPVCEVVNALVAEAERVDDMIERTSKSVCCHLTWITSAHAVGCDNVAASTVVVPPNKATPVTIPVRRLPQYGDGVLPGPAPV
jgi:hypothetical protein